MTTRSLVEAWLVLTVLSATTTLTTTFDPSGRSRIAVTAFVLLLAGLKSRVILGRYLGLRNSPFWTRGFDFAIALFLAVAFALYAIGSGD